jgi:hypothetical protein
VRVASLLATTERQAILFSRSNATMKKIKIVERSELLLPPTSQALRGVMNATFSSPSPAGRRRGAYMDVFTAWLEKVAFITPPSKATTPI